MTYRYVDAEIWSDPWFESLGSDQKLLFLYFITNERISPAGVLETSIRQLGHHLGIGNLPDPHLAALEEKAPYWYVGNSIWVFVKNYLRRQRTHTNPANYVKWARKSMDNLPAEVYDALVAEYPELVEGIQVTPKRKIKPEPKPTTNGKPEVVDEHKHMVGVLMALEGHEPPVPRGVASRLAKVAKELRELDATPEEVSRRAALYKRLKPDWDFTANALLKWWSAIPAWKLPGGGLARTILDTREGEHGTEPGEGDRGLPGGGISLAT